MDVEAWVQTVQAGHDPRQQIGRNGRDDADPQPSRQPALRGAGKLAQFVHGPQDLPRAADEVLAEPGEPNLPGTALDQRATDDRLQLPNLGREGRLRNAAGLRRPAEMAMLGQRVKIAEMAQGQRVHNFILSER